MELLWGIFLIVTIFSHTEAGRPRPPPSARVIDKRVGPFFTNEQRRIYNHPYMDDHFRGQPARVREQQRYPQEVPSSQISNRKLLMPIISEGYASTKIQGGTRGKTKVEEKPVQMKANVIEQAQVEEISSTRPSTTTTPIPTSATKDVVTNNKVEEPLSSPYFPDIPDLIAQGAAEDTSKNYDVSANSASVATGDNPFIIREEEYAYPPPPPVPAPKPPTPVIRPVIRENRPLASDRIDIGTGSAEPVSLFDGEDSLSAPPNFAAVATQQQTVQTNTNDYVRIVASPPKKFNVVPNERLPLSNVDEQGFFKPPKAEYSDKYLAGYEQIDYPDQGGKFPNVNPELIDPDDYHQDRPSFHASQVYGSPTKDFYPLGKPPQPAKVTPDLLTQGQDAQFSFKPKIDRPEKKKQEGGSFFDFFKLPSFVRASNKADPEGPIIRPKPKRPKVPLNKPKPVRPQGKIPPRSPPQGPPSAPAGPPGVPGVPDLSHFPHMKNPNRPIGTFPQPHEYGGKLNPIVIRVPEGFPGAGPPPPPGAPAPISYPPPQTALKKKIGLSRVDAEPNLVEEEYPEQPQPPKAMVKLPPSPPLLRRPKPPNAALKMTSQPVNPAMPGVAMPPPMRKQEPFLRKKPVRRPLLNLPGIPQAHQRYPHPNYSEAEPKIDLNQYKEKLKDPDFHQNLTKAHVFHATDLEEDVEEVDREEASVPSLTKALLSYLQDANPFNFRPKNKPARVHTINRMTPADIERLPQNQEVTDESRLIDFAPIARQTNKVEKIDKPEVVYKPTQSTTTTSSTATTFTTTTTSIATTEQETTTTEDPIASHVNFLLQQYFSTQTPHTDPEAIPMITYDDENQSIVMEYVSPDGEHGSVDKLEEPVQKAADPQITSFFPELPENPEDLILPQGMTSLERVFEPSKSTDEADWFVLDENNVRVDLQDQEELEQDSEEDVALEERSEEIGIETDVESSTDRFTVGDFEPIISPDYVA